MALSYIHPKPLGLDSIVFFYIAGMLGIHQPVPDPEIEPIIPLELAVMEIVIDGGIEYFKKKRMSESTGQDLISQVAIHIDHKSTDGEQQDGQGMHRNKKDNDQQHGAFRPGFYKMKGIGGPGRRIGGPVMQQMGYAKDLGVVQQTMHPIEISIVDDEAQQHTDRDPPTGICGEMEIHLRISRKGCIDDQKCNNGQDKGGLERVDDLPLKVLSGGMTLLDLVAGEAAAGPAVKDEKRDARNDEIAQS